MKRVLDFFYCPGTFTPDVVWYQVLCGRAQRDLQARRLLIKMIAGNRAFFLADHSQDLANFRENLASQVFPMCHRATSMLRTSSIHITQLVAFLKKAPACLLNSKRVDTPVTPSQMILAGYRSSAEIQRERQKSLRDSRKHANPLNVKNLSKHGKSNN